MKYDLTSVGIHTNLQYECITTTINSEKERIPQLLHSSTLEKTR